MQLSDTAAPLRGCYRCAHSWNRLRGEGRALASKSEYQLADLNRRTAGIIEPIERGIITPSTKQRVEAARG